VDRDQGGALIATSDPALLALRLLTGESTQMAALQCVLEAAPAYYRITTGAPARGALAQSVFTALPPDKTYDDKFVWGLYANDAMIGCADVIRAYPTQDTAVIGLLLLAEAWQRKGLGRALAMLVEQAIATWPEITTLRLGVVRRNVGALTFWRKLGYRETGEVKPPGHDVAHEVLVMQKSVARGPSP
jgi:RimJ/RimL family protein N-acetyltransferase